MLAAFGFVMCTAGAVIFAARGLSIALVAVAGFFALVALVDMVVIVSRKRHV